MKDLIAASDVEKKPCGSCAMCCKVIPIDEPSIGKPAGKWCKHWSKAKLCTIYEQRPQSCSAFQCLWTLVPQLGEEARPDKSKAVLAIYGEGVLVVYCDPLFPDAWWQGEVGDFLEAWPERFMVQTGEYKVLRSAQGVKVHRMEGR